MRYQLRYVRARPRRRRRVAHSRLAHAFDGIQTLWAGRTVAQERLNCADQDGVSHQGWHYG